MKCNDSIRKLLKPQKSHRSKSEIKLIDIAFRVKTSKGLRMINNYLIQDTIGKGSFGTVKLAVKQVGLNEEYYAIKCFHRNFLKSRKIVYKDKNGSNFNNLSDKSEGYDGKG